MTRESPSDKPQMPGYPIGDMSGGLFSAFAITEALLSRELGNTGGEYIDVAMSDVVASFSQSVAYQALTGDPEEPRPGNTHLSGQFPWYDSYETADGDGSPSQRSSRSSGERSVRRSTRSTSSTHTTNTTPTRSRWSGPSWRRCSRNGRVPNGRTRSGTWTRQLAAFTVLRRWSTTRNSTRAI